MEENRCAEQCCHHESGHEHYHEKDHEHEYHHEHEHHHEHHEHCHEHEHSHEEKGIFVTVHEGAVVGTVKYTVPHSLNITLGDIKEKLAEIAEIIEEEGGYIGHIKGIIQESGRMCRISVVESGRMDTEMMEHSDTTDIECVLIVFNMDVPVMRKILEQKFGDTF